MATYTLPLTPNATRTWTSQELANLSFQLNASGQRWLKTESVAVVRLGERGRLALVQVDDFQAGRTLVNLYDWDWDPTQEFNLRLSLQGLSQWGTLSDAIAAQGYSALLPVTTLASVHIMLYLDVLPSSSEKWHAIDESQTHLSQLVKRTVNKTFRQLFEHHDLSMIRRVVNKLLRSTQIVENFETHIRQSVHKHIKNVRTTHEGDIMQLHQTRQHITNNYQAGLP